MVSRNRHNEKQGYDALTSRVSILALVSWEYSGFEEILMACVSVLIQTLSSEIPSQVSNQPLWKCPLEQLTHQCVRIQSGLKSALQPPLTHGALCGFPLMQTGYKLSQLRKSPPSSSFYLPIGRWMVEIRIPGETWDGENRNKDFPMSGTDVSFSTAFSFHPKGSCQTEGRRTRAHIIPFKRLPVLSHAISSARITMEFQDPAVTPL